MNLPIDTSALKLYDLILMVMGASLFLACLIIFIVKSIKSEASSTLLFFFALSIIMVGFPAITKLKIGGQEVSIEKELSLKIKPIVAGEINRNTVDQFHEVLNKLEKSGKSITDPGLLTSIAKAQYEIGAIDQAKIYTEKALAVDRYYHPAVALQKGITTLEKHTAFLETALDRIAAPDATAKDSAAVKNTLTVLQRSSIKLSNPELLKRAADFEVKTGNRSSASALLDRAKTIETLTP